MSKDTKGRRAAPGIAAAAVAMLLAFTACSRDADRDLTAEDLLGATEIDSSYATRGDLFGALRSATPSACDASLRRRLHLPIKSFSTSEWGWEHDAAAQRR